MPIGLSPRNTVPIWLDTDVADYPDASTRPTFFARFMSAESVADFWLLHARFFEEKADRKKQIRTMVEMLKLGIARWTNIDGATNADGQPVTLTWENMHQVLRYEELDELTDKMLEKTRLAVQEKKPSASPSPGGGAPSAAPAPTGESAPPSK